MVEIHRKHLLIRTDNLPVFVPGTKGRTDLGCQGDLHLLSLLGDNCRAKVIRYRPLLLWQQFQFCVGICNIHDYTIEIDIIVDFTAQNGESGVSVDVVFRGEPDGLRLGLYSWKLDNYVCIANTVGLFRSEGYALLIARRHAQHHLFQARDRSAYSREHIFRNKGFGLFVVFNLLACSVLGYIRSGGVNNSPVLQGRGKVDSNQIPFLHYVRIFS